MATKSEQVVHGPFVAIGNRGISCPDYSVLPKGLSVGLQPLPPKVRMAAGAIQMGQEPLWVSSHSWVQSRRTEDGSEAKFRLERVEDAVRKGHVKLVKGATFTRKSDGKKYTGDVLLPADWQNGQKQPRVVGVINCKGWEGGRIESQLVNEPDGSEARNKYWVAKIELPGAAKDTKKAEATEKASKNSKAKSGAKADKGQKSNAKEKQPRAKNLAPKGEKQDTKAADALAAA